MTEAECIEQIRNLRATLIELRTPNDPFVTMIDGEATKRAIIIAAAGDHGIFLYGAHDDLKLPVQACEALNIRHWAALPCRCGFYGHPYNPCKCSIAVIRKQENKIRREIRGLNLEMMHNPYPVSASRALAHKRPGTTLADAKKQLEVCTNYSDLTMDEATECLMRHAGTEFRMDPPQIQSVVRIARTIANLEGKEKLAPHHIAEAVQYSVARFMND